MPRITHLGLELYYEIDGAHVDREAVVLLHGGLATSASWTRAGYTDALGERYTVIRPDAIGHGRSDGSLDPTRNGLRARAADVVAVLDDAGVERAHVIGYSMGGWTASGLALHEPERLSSLVVGGWDLVDGMATMAAAMGAQDMRFRQILGLVRRFAPASLEWLAVDREEMACAAGDAITELAGTADALVELRVPRLLWLGVDDPYHPTMSDFAAEHDIDVLTVGGDHLANETSAETSIAGLLAFLARAQSATR